VVQSMLPKLFWQLDSSNPCVTEPGLQHPTPVVIDHPVPVGQPHLSTPAEGTAPASAVQSAFPRATWHSCSSNACVIDPGLQQPRPVLVDHPVPAVQPHASRPLPMAWQSVFP
jgi:hypothetical protein